MSSKQRRVIVRPKIDVEKGPLNEEVEVMEDGSVVRKPAREIIAKMDRMRVYIWPCYLDQDLPRSKGRKVLPHETVPDPTLREITYAAQCLGLTGRYDDLKKHPRNYWKRGLLMINFWKPSDEDPSVRVPIHPVIHTRKQLYKALGLQLIKVRGLATVVPTKKLHGADKTKYRKLVAKGILPGPQQQ